MHCFAHNDKDAIAVCKHCYKAVCNICARDLTFGIACSEKCEKNVNESGEMTERALRVYGIGQHRPKIPEAAIWQIIMAFGFGAFGGLMLLKNKWHFADVSYFFFFSLLFLAVGLRTIFRKTGVRGC